jgi:two-component system cell cycle response regulator CpdR
MQSPKILVADDEESVRTYVGRILAMNGFEVVEAADGADALQHIETGDAIDLLLTDVRMPRMDGIELARSAHAICPHLPVLYISGYPFDVDEERRIYPAKICAFVAKPFTPKTLVEAVRRCLKPAEKSSHA